MHLGPTYGKKWTQKVVDLSNSLKPDLVAITGDLIDGSVEQLREDVAPLAGLKSKDGTFFVTGNHEYYFDAASWIEHLQTLNMTVLVNQRVRVQRAGAALDIAGVGDQTGLRMPPGGGTDIPRALQGRDKSHPCVLLAHQPRVIEEAFRQGVDLVLAGHTHGGQIWPFNFLVYLQQPYVKGLHNHKGTQIYVSQGTGTWGPPIRLGTHAELTQIVLRSA
jgi:predicted MPP superfamily phosphohydrolase